MPLDLEKLFWRVLASCLAVILISCTVLVVHGVYTVVVSASN